MKQPKKMDWDAVGRRLRALQQALGGLTDEEMGKMIGAKRTAWNNYANGKKPLPPEAVRDLRNQWQISADYFFAGDSTVSLNKELQSKIDHAERNPTPPRRGRRPLQAPE